VRSVENARPSPKNSDISSKDKPSIRVEWVRSWRAIENLRIRLRIVAVRNFKMLLSTISNIRVMVWNSNNSVLALRLLSSVLELGRWAVK
jgi:hypothetical protein